MSLTSAELQNYFNEVEASLNSAKRCAATAVNFAAGRLRSMNISAYTLQQLKIELQDFNARKGKWRPR